MFQSWCFDTFYSAVFVVYCINKVEFEFKVRLLIKRKLFTGLFFLYFLLFLWLIYTEKIPPFLIFKSDWWMWKCDQESWGSVPAAWPRRFTPFAFWCGCSVCSPAPAVCSLPFSHPPLAKSPNPAGMWPHCLRFAPGGGKPGRVRRLLPGRLPEESGETSHLCPN